MKKIKNCKHCYEAFEARRSNHVYCTTSCKTKASYKRNDYKYVSGHYKKTKNELIEQEHLMVPDVINTQIQSLENKINVLVENQKDTQGINASHVKSAAIGSAAADVAVFTAKKLFMPHTLPATKGDLEDLKKEIQNLKFLLNVKKQNGY